MQIIYCLIFGNRLIDLSHSFPSKLEFTHTKIQTIHIVFRDDLIRHFVGVPLLSGVDDFHRRVGCVKPDVI